jgi:outer membrane protein, multidrug efflux system
MTGPTQSTHAFATFAVLGLIFLPACASLHPPPPVVATLADHAPTFTTDLPAGSAWPGTRWWTAYEDPTLNQLIATAIGNASDMASADARVRQAEQAVRVTAAALGVKTNANTGYSFQRLSDNGMLPPEFLGYHWYDQADLGISLRYQLDWWGKERAAIAAAIDRSRAVAAERQAATIMLAAKVAETYFGWQADTARITLQEQTITVQENLLGNAERRIAAQLEPADLATETRLQLAEQREQLEALTGSRRLRRVTLAALLGVDATALPDFPARQLPDATTRLPDDVGTNLLARRPDIAASRWRVEAALRDTDIQRAAFYPDISINALAGMSALDPGKLLLPGSATPRLGVAINLPLFDGGQRHAQHRAAQAAVDVAITAYDTAVNNAAREASTAAAVLRTATLQRQQREQQLDAAALLVDAAQARMNSQLTHAGPALSARLRKLAAQDALLQINHSALIADIELKRALGGDATTEPAP